MKMKDLPKIERPREKLARYGASKLTGSELLAIILGSGSGKLNVLELAGKILGKLGAKGLSSADLADLKNISGLGSARASALVSCFELGRRFLKDEKNHLIVSPETVCQELRYLSSRKKEHFAVFCLDAQNRMIKKEIVSIGTLTASLIHPREVFEPAIVNLAASVIIAHNHPSGIIDPSEDDLKITARLVEAGKILGIQLLDHVIFFQNIFFSFKNQNLI